MEDRLDYALYAKAIVEFIRHPDAKPPMVMSVQPSCIGLRSPPESGAGSHPTSSDTLTLSR